MNHLLSPELFERKQVGLLYHYTTIEGCIAMLKANVMQSDPDITGDAAAICFTRDKWLHKSDPRIAGTAVKMTFDGDRLSDTVKLYPHDDNYIRRNGKLKKHRYYRDEKEERTKDTVDMRTLVAIVVVKLLFPTERFLNQYAEIEQLAAPLNVPVSFRDEEANNVVKYVRWRNK